MLRKLDIFISHSPGASSFLNIYGVGRMSHGRLRDRDFFVTKLQKFNNIGQEAPETNFFPCNNDDITCRTRITSDKD